MGRLDGQSLPPIVDAVGAILKYLSIQACGRTGSFACWQLPGRPARQAAAYALAAAGQAGVEYTQIFARNARGDDSDRRHQLRRSIGGLPLIAGALGRSLD
jgi:hypothetical protein